MITKTFRKGEYIFRHGDHSDVAYIINAGAIEILKETTGKSVVICKLGIGEIFGEMGLVDEKPRSAAARAIDDTELTIIERNEFVDILFTNTEQCIRFVRALFERLRHMNSMLGPDVHERIVGNINPDRYHVRLIPLTERAALEIPKDGMKLGKIPFRIGRRSLNNERSTLDYNDLVLNDTAPFNVSKNHLIIEHEDNEYVVVDRGSYFGTIVNGDRIGGNRLEGRANLNVGSNNLVIGNNESLFRFEIMVEVDAPT